MLQLLPIKRLPMLGVKGPRAADWLIQAGLTLPEHIYDIVLAQESSRLLRIGTTEYVVEGSLVIALTDQLGGGGDGVYPVQRQEVVIHLVGDERAKVLAQTCGLNPDELATGKIYYTRIAGAIVAILPHADRYELWVDPSLAEYLSQTLDEIVCGLVNV